MTTILQDLERIAKEYERIGFDINVLVGRLKGNQQRCNNNQQLFRGLNSSTQLDNLIKLQSTVKGAKKENKEMPQQSPQYSDGSFTLNFRKSGLMRYQFMFEGKRRAVYGYSALECYKKREDYISGKKTIKSKNQFTVGEWCEHYYKTYKTRKDGTEINPDNKRYIKYIQNAPIGKKPLSRIVGLDIQSFLNEYGDKPNTQNKIAIFINEFLQNAADNDLIKKNPSRAVKIEKHTPKGYNVLQPKDQNKILAFIQNSPQYEAVFWYLTCTGMRLDTALKAIDNIDFENCTITPTKRNTKTKKHQTTIPFLPELLTADRVKLLKQVTYHGIEDYFKKVFDELGIEAVVHSFRKTFASVAYHVGFKDKQIQEWLAHTELKTTTDTYVFIIENEQSPIIDYFKRLKEHLKL